MRCFLPFGAIAHKTRLSLLGACGGNEGHPGLCKSNPGGLISHVCGFNHSKLDAKIVLLTKNLEIHKSSPICNFGRFFLKNYLFFFFLFLGWGGNI
jgi:hypothetical protein